MELLLFSVYIILFWGIAFFLLLGGFAFYSKKRIRKFTFTLAAISFSVPIIIFGINKLDSIWKVYQFEGTYIANDSLNNEFIIVINNSEFIITTSKCPEKKLTGYFNYIDEYDDFLYYYNELNNKIYINQNDSKESEISIETDFNSNCFDLKKLNFNKK